MKKAILFIILLLTCYVAKSQQYVNMLGKNKADVMGILSKENNLEFKSFSKSLDGVQYLFYSVVSDPRRFEAFFINSDGICYIVKHVLPMEMYPQVVKSFNERPNYTMKENDLWVDSEAKLAFSIRSIPNSQSFTLEVTSFK